jgi:hypothetical protein
MYMQAIGDGQGLRSIFDLRDSSVRNQVDVVAEHVRQAHQQVVGTLAIPLRGDVARVPGPFGRVPPA